MGSKRSFRESRIPATNEQIRMISVVQAPKSKDSISAAVALQRIGSQIMLSKSGVIDRPGPFQSSPSGVHVRVVARRRDAFHLLAQQRAEARAALHHAVPAVRFVVAAPVDPAEVVGDRDL